MKINIKIQIMGISLILLLTMIFLSNSNADPSLSQTSGKIMVLAVEGIDGESQFAESEDDHDILAFSWGAQGSSSFSTGERSTGRINFEDLFVMKYLDSSSPKFLEKLAKQEHITDIVLSVYWNGNPTWEYKLENVIITSIYTGGSGASSDKDLESISFSYGIITMTAWEYDDQGKSKGSTSFTWNIEENREG